MDFNILKGKSKDSFDAIVIGSGITGGWAAKELTEKGMKTLLLEKGPLITYPGLSGYTWRQLLRNDELSQSDQAKYSIQSRVFPMRDSLKRFWVNDVDHPYTETKAFDWIRGYHLGGRSITWARQCYRLSDLDFESNEREKVGIDWPIRYGDLAPWYDYVERFIGVSGQHEGLEQLPDGFFQSPMKLNKVEKLFKANLYNHYQRTLTIGRVANLTDGIEGSNRKKCVNLNRCMYGCPRGAYFNSIVSTLPAARKTGNLLVRANSVVSKVIFDEKKNKASGVEVIDAETKEIMEFSAKVIFLCSSTLGSTSILLNSTSSRFPNGFGNDSGELGHNLMDHHGIVGAEALYHLPGAKNDTANRPNGFYIPRFRNLGTDKRDYLRGFGYQGGSSVISKGGFRPSSPLIYKVSKGLGVEYDWRFKLLAFGEMLPYHENHVSLNHNVTDKYGLPTLNIDCEFKENEKHMRIDMANDAAEMLATCGFKDVVPFNKEHAPGHCIHEMGTARMGLDPATSILNKWNQVHTCKNVFVTDGACMSSSGSVGPSLTYMALTARAANFAATELKNNNI